MSGPKRTPAGAALTDVILDLFRLNSRILKAGDRLVAPLRLTSARWQILGAIAETDRPQPVAWLARDLGANRQNVQRVVNDLQHEGFAEFQANPHHRRAQLVVMTDKGRRTLEAAMRLQAPWVNDLAAGLSVKDVEALSRAIRMLRRNLERSGDPADGAAG